MGAEMLELSAGGYKGWCARCVGFRHCLRAGWVWVAFRKELDREFVVMDRHFGRYFGPDCPGLFLAHGPLPTVSPMFFFTIVE